MPPHGEHWCVSRRDARGVVFGKNLFGGRVLYAPPSRVEIAHTFILMAVVHRTDAGTLESPERLQAFAEAWLRAPPHGQTAVRKCW